MPFVNLLFPGSFGIGGGGLVGAGRVAGRFNLVCDMGVIEVCGLDEADILTFSRD